MIWELDIRGIRTLKDLEKKECRRKLSRMLKIIKMRCIQESNSVSLKIRKRNSKIKRGKDNTFFEI